MPLTSGTRLGPYEVLEPIGAGGMGEVYRARDTKLERDVAIKVLPEEFARDAERLARFEREAKLLASLNHPNIASIHGFEETDGVKAIVLELVEGPTLAERIAEGPIPVDEALPIARQIAEALEAGHEAGVIHRDLKPANVKVKEDGTVKVLDYGLAKALEGEAATSADSELSQSPTLTRQGTQIGVILGTAAYMSPEQATGKKVEKRTDVFAFGAVLYEMLTGKMAFPGADVSESLARVIEREPDWSMLPAKTDDIVRRLLRRCLQKDRRERLPDIGVARLDIGDAMALPATAELTPVSSRIRNLWAVSAAALAIVAGVVGWNLARPEHTPQPVTRTSIALNENTRLANLVYPVVGSRVWNTPIELSRDGRTVYFIGEQNGKRHIYRRSLGQSQSEAVADTDGAELVFLSPDDEWIGFFAKRQLKKMPLDGKASVTFYEGLVEYAQWGPDNIVVFQESRELWQIDAAGGEPKQITSGGGGYLKTHSVLPGGQAVLAANPSMGGRVMLVPLSTGEPRELTIGVAPQYVPSGHIVFLRGTSLWAIPFDVDRLEVTGAPLQVLEGVVERGMLPNYAVSSTGSLVYVPARRAARSQRLVWVERDGTEEPLDLEPGSYRIPRLSPDASRVVYDDCCHEADPPLADIWIYDLASRNATRLTFDSIAEAHPAWSTDGTRVAFLSIDDPAGASGSIRVRSAAGTGDAGLLIKSTNPVPQAFSPDGKFLIYSDARDIFMLGQEQEATATPILKTPALESGAYIAPDGQWLAFASDESGQSEIYVRPFPDVENGRWQVSTDGGAEVAWAHDGTELYYRDGDRMMRVAVNLSSTFSYGPPGELFDGRYDTHRARNYDVAPDGRFLMVKDVTPPDRASAREHLVLVQNWFEELKRLVPTQ